MDQMFQFFSVKGNDDDANERLASLTRMLDVALNGAATILATKAEEADPIDLAVISGQMAWLFEQVGCEEPEVEGAIRAAIGRFCNRDDVVPQMKAAITKGYCWACCRMEHRDEKSETDCPIYEARVRARDEIRNNRRPHNLWGRL